MGEELRNLQAWYVTNCDGDWEHTYGIRISTLDNPGWMLSVDLAQTPLEGKKFEEVVVETDESNWYQCRVQNQIFEGAGGPMNLADLIRTFTAWTLYH